MSWTPSIICSTRSRRRNRRGVENRHCASFGSVSGFGVLRTVLLAPVPADAFPASCRGRAFSFCIAHAKRSGSAEKPEFRRPSFGDACACRYCMGDGQRARAQVLPRAGEPHRIRFLRLYAPLSSDDDFPVRSSWATSPSGAVLPARPWNVTAGGSPSCGAFFLCSTRRRRSSLRSPVRIGSGRCTTDLSRIS